jgi:WD40-like Beta Propeller Repeat/Calcineurin-like phosphoesterase
MRRCAFLICVLAVALAPATGAQAAFRGHNGLLGYAGRASKLIYLRGTDGHGVVRRLAASGRPQDPAFSPQGLRIAYATSDGRLWTSYLDGSPPLPIVTHVSQSRDPTWSPGGDRIAFAGGPVGARDIFTVVADGSGLAQLTFSDADEYAPAWSAANQLAFVRNGGRSRGDIVTMNTAGGAQRRVTASRADDEAPAWSPSGRWLAFTRSTKKGRDLYVVRFDGRRLRRLTRLGTSVSSPAWSPSGRWIAFAAGRAGHHALYVVRTTGRRLRRVANSTTNPSAVDWQPTGADPTIMAAGDIACDPGDPAFNGGNGTDAFCHERGTSNLLLRRDLSGILVLGDAQYEDNAYSKFLVSFAPTWGRLKSLEHPTVGNHEVRTPGAAGYYDYFDGIGKADGPAGPRGLGYYSFDIGTWHIVSLNSECANAGGPSLCDFGSAQQQWLQADLAAHPAKCTLAFWHRPLVSSGIAAVNTSVVPLWQTLYDAGADLVLTGHDHAYERFGQMQSDLAADPVRGLRQFVVGTGGKDLQASGPPKPNSQLRRAAYGVLQLTLHPTSYDWAFVREGGTVLDAGHTDCH